MSPSLKCYQCGKVRRCKLYVWHPEGVPFSQTLADLSYLCKPCARVLGYLTKESES